MLRTEVIIPTIHAFNYETGNEYLTDLLESIDKCGDKDDLDIHIIENQPSFHAAANKGFGETVRDVILLNDDTVVSKHFFSKLTDGYGDIRGCKVFAPDNQLLHAGGTIALGDFHGAHLGYGAVDTGQFNFVAPCPFVTFAGVYIRREVINELGGLSSEFGRIYFDDMDFCFRAWQNGFFIAYNPIPMIHVETASMKQEKVNIKELYLSGLEKFREKWYKKETVLMLREKMKLWEIYYDAERARKMEERQ